MFKATWNYDSPSYMYLVTNQEVNSNTANSGFKAPESSASAYKTIAAHEMGHILGLNDAYEGRNSKGKEVIRLDKSIETAVDKDHQGWKNCYMDQQKVY